MKKNVFFAPLFLYNLALITHDATKSVSPSISSGVGGGKANKVPLLAPEISENFSASRHFSKNNLHRFSILTLCNERYGTRTTTLSSRNQRTPLMQKIIKPYTHSHNYSNTEVRRTTNSLNLTMVFVNMHEHSSQQQQQQPFYFA